MRGFDDKALMLFPNSVIYETNNLKYRAMLQTASAKMFRFLQSKAMRPHAFITDDLAKMLPGLDFTWVSPLAIGDLFFLSQNCDHCENIMTLSPLTYPELYVKSEKKYPIEPGSKLSVQERFDIVSRREKFVAQAIIPTYRVVVQFQKSKKNLYKAASKPNDDKIRIIVNADNFSVTSYMSGEEGAADEILGVDFANRSVVNWEV